ncbi:MAG: hypothetical protein KF887_15980 [Paracoccaceae bacterium]|nr:MAG: hypothetical protein KF887_15980 [Paracoccaceae bacterium]
MESIIPLIIQALSGAAGGGLAGATLKSSPLSSSLRLIVGALGGIGGNAALGGTVSGLLGAASASGLDIMSIVSQVISGGVGGAVLTGLAGILSGMAKK